MATGAIETLSDAELEAQAAQLQEALQQRKERRRMDAIEQARGILAAVGLTFREAEKLGSAAKAKRGGVKAQSRKGQRFVNPANADQSWTAGAGRKPKWLTTLEAAGTAPQPVSG